MLPGPRDWGGVGGTRHGREVPARPLREPPRRRRRRRRRVGRRSRSSRSTSDAPSRTHRGGRPGHELVPSARGRSAAPTMRSRSSRATWSSRSSGRAWTRPGGSTRRRWRGPRRCWRDTAAARGRSAPTGSAWRPRARCATPRTATRSSRCVRRHADADPEVIAGEAGGRAVVPRRHPRAATRTTGRSCVLDIGGGSTEFVVGREPGRGRRSHQHADGGGSADGAARAPRPAGRRRRSRRSGRRWSSVLSEAESAVPDPRGAHLRLRGRHRDDDPGDRPRPGRYDPDGSIGRGCDSTTPSGSWPTSRHDQCGARGDAR